ncbi:hypothetical protein LCGC14_2372600, partial [marine sediment metagenome]
AKTLRVYGLQTWDTAETTEDIVMDGTANVATSKAYVIIHRMQVLTKGSNSTNDGTITATAQSDSTVTAQIGAGKGQTLMAIYGIPSTQVAYLTSFYVGVLKRTTALVDVTLLVNPEPETELTNFGVKMIIGLNTAGQSDIQHFFAPYKKVTGPAILKVRVDSSAQNTSATGGFDIIIVDN